MNGRVDSRHGPVLPADVGEILSLREASFDRPVVRALLRPEEEAVSLPQLPAQVPAPIAPLTRYLGPALTVLSMAWYGNPVPRLRALQKVLVEQSLKQAENDRAECLAAISVVEKAVQLRLRLQQMRMTAAEMENKTEGLSNHEKPRQDRFEEQAHSG